ncbi:MAG TPA: hypothetical protein VHH73_20745 [Verrucomicrobiae bacterium]|nr:hypothetical protein [Verrucomicrobiae bacterium]
MKCSRLLLCLLARVVLGHSSAVAQDIGLKRWHLRYPETWAADFHGAASSGGTSVIVGAEGTVAVSEDDLHWDYLRLEDNFSLRDLNDVTYADGRFVAVGDHVIFTSADGRHWNRQDAPVSLNAVSASPPPGNQTIIAVGEFGTVLTSTDGFDWIVARTEPEIPPYIFFPEGIYTFHLTSITCGIVDGKPLYMAFGSRFLQNQVLTSTNAVDWQLESDPIFYGSSTAFFGNNRFVRNAGHGLSIWSTNGVTWTASNIGFPGGALIAFAHGWFFYGDFSFGRLFASTDAVTWTPLRDFDIADNAGHTFPPNQIIYGRSHYIGYGDLNRIWTSDDAVTWTRRDASILPRESNLLFQNGVFFSGSNNTVNGVVSSADGVHWQRRGELPANTLDIATGNGIRLAAINFPGYILRSMDGATWNAINTGFTNQLTAITYGNGCFVAAPGNRAIYYSLDGLTWREIPLPYLGSFGGLAWCNGVFVVVDRGFTSLYFSTDGLNWQVEDLPFRIGSLALLGGNGTLLAVDNVGRIFQSDPVIRLDANPAVAGQLTLSAMSGQSYRVDYTDSPATTNWLTLTNITLAGANTTAILRDPNAGSSARFYRAVWQP